MPARYASEDAIFNIKEVDVGLAADLGTLQRLPKMCGNDSILRELAYTARNFSAAEAASFGMVSKVLPNREDAVAAAVETAALIASKSPVAVTCTKATLNYARDHSVADGLAQVLALNSAMLQTADIGVILKAAQEKNPNPDFPDLL